MSTLLISLPIMPITSEDLPANAPQEPQESPNTVEQPVTMAVRMPPPADAILFAPPPLPTYTTKQAPNYTPQTPSPPSGVSVAVLAAQVNRPTHNSSANAMQHEWIHSHNLYPIRPVDITYFRDRIQSMESIRFGHQMALAWQVSPMRSEGCVTGYLDAQVLGAAWEAVLQMLPRERDYDLQMVKQVPAMDGVPDQTYSVLRQDTCETLAVVELKSSGVVQAMLPVIRNSRAGVRTDITDDWKAVTRQLRMYATGCKTRDVLVMDEGVGIYFRFPPDPNDDDEVHQYLYASTALGQSFDGELKLSLRDLVVFALFSAFDRNNIELRDFTAEPPSPRLEETTWTTETRRQAPKRGKRNDPPQETFDRMVVGTTIKLELIPGKTPILTARPRASSLDSGFHEEGTDNSPKTSTRTLMPSLITSCGPPEATVTATVTVERILKKNVALVTDGKTHFIAKMFPPNTVDNPERMLNKELDVYRTCASLQGTYIPYLYGVYRAVKRPPYFSSPILLTEYIGIGRTIADMVYLAGELDDDEFFRAEEELAVLKASAINAIGCLHRMKVIHADLTGNNMVVNKEQVVLVDFSYSLVLKTASRKFEVRWDDDLKHLNRAFELEY